MFTSSYMVINIQYDHFLLFSTGPLSYSLFYYCSKFQAMYIMRKH